jgi:hypothetical protein
VGVLVGFSLVVKGLQAAVKNTNTIGMRGVLDLTLNKETVKHDDFLNRVANPFVN